MGEEGVGGSTGEGLGALGDLRECEQLCVQDVYQRVDLISKVLPQQSPKTFPVSGLQEGWGRNTNKVDNANN